MQLSGNTILITGGATGIGLAFAERFLRHGNQVIICGRRADALQKAKKRVPGLITRVCDLTSETERVALFDWTSANYPHTNVLVNNAGVLRPFNVLKAEARTDWSSFNAEITTNLEAPIHLSMLFAPHFARMNQAAIINVSSGLAFTPLAVTPIYSATKAALHSFTMCLRLQLTDTSIEVIEVVPPAVDTDLNGVWLRFQPESADVFADGIFNGLDRGDMEIGYGSSAERMRMSRSEQDAFAATMYSATKASIE